MSEHTTFIISVEDLLDMSLMKLMLKGREHEARQCRFRTLNAGPNTVQAVPIPSGPWQGTSWPFNRNTDIVEIDSVLDLLDSTVSDPEDCFTSIDQRVVYKVTHYSLLLTYANKTSTILRYCTTPDAYIPVPAGIQINKSDQYIHTHRSRRLENNQELNQLLNYANV